MGLIFVCVLLFSILINGANGIPVLDLDTYFVCEDVPTGIAAFQILAKDTDGGRLTYSLRESNTFRVEPSNGTVYATRSLDREAEPSTRLQISISNSLSEIIDRDIFVLINDTNDNVPQFEELSYEKEVSESTPVNTTLFKVLAVDKDTGAAGRVNYRIDETIPDQDVFWIDTLGNFILKKKLDYKLSGPSYRIQINASDNGGRCYEDEVIYYSSRVFAYITVVDVPDLDPQFIGVPFTASVEENTPNGEHVLTVTAVDQDTGINDKILYSIQEATPEGLFRIDEAGAITVDGEIDREEIGDTVKLTVKATELNLNIHGVQASTTAQVHITITDVNDNSPEFYKCATECVPDSNFFGQVKENSLGTVFINMTVKDADKNALTELSLDGIYKDVFSVEPAVAFSDSVVQLIVKNPTHLDFEKIQQMSLELIAVDQKDRSRRSTANVIIDILDTNDNSPTFTNGTYQAEVPEHSTDGTPVILITAMDPDSMDVGKITYRLLPESILQYFDVRRTTGEVYVKSGALLDREVRALYSVTLQAQDSDGKAGSTVLDITLTDINDKRPVPNIQTYQEFVLEGGNLENVKIEATDGDEPGTANSQLLFSIEPGPYSENFTIDPDTGVLTNNGPLDRENITLALNGKIELRVNISDRGEPPLSTLVRVVINVQDVNDNKPAFGQSSYNFSVKEGEKGAFVGSVFAEDHDQTTEFNRISFSIRNGSFGSFTVRSVLDAPGYVGEINVDQDIELDYERIPAYSLQVQAVDFAQEKADIIVEVHVLDVNDERPEMKPVSPVEVEENSNETRPIGTFLAVDKDGNHSLIFEQRSVRCRCDGEDKPCDWFTVQTSGAVVINPEADIDYESCDQATVEAEVMDEYTEKGEATSGAPGKMVINILDVNDNTPEFVYSTSVFVLVSETSSIGASVAGLSAIDRDSGANGRIEFQVSKVQFQKLDGEATDVERMPFEASTTQQNNLYVGQIKSTEEVDTTLKGKYLVWVEARDTGGLTNSTVLEIFIVDTGYKSELGFDAPRSQIDLMRSDIIRDLTVITQASVQVVKIRDQTSESTKASAITIMEAYFVYGNGTAILYPTVAKILSQPQNFLLMSKYGLVAVGFVNPEEQKVQTEMFVLFGMVGGLVIVTVVLATSFACTRRNYRRKLKAANAMKSASGLSVNQKGGPVVPGTNQYTMEGANPVLNLNIDPSIALDLGEDSDVDKVSLNSLDNSDDTTVYEKDTKPIMQKIQEEEDDDGGQPKYIEPLGAALAQRDQKLSSNNPLLGHTNPLFDTTDL